MVLDELNDSQTVIVIGRGHGGTRVASSLLQNSGVFMGAKINGSGDLIPPQPLYDAVRLFGRQVDYLGNDQWRFPYYPEVTPAIRESLEEYLGGFSGSPKPRGWKIPEALLIYPLLVNLFPKAKFIWWTRDPRDALAKFHWTDDFVRFGMPGRDGVDRPASYLYQHLIVAETPPPEHFIHVRYEDAVLTQQVTRKRLERFLGYPIKPVMVLRDRAYCNVNEKVTPDYLVPVAMSLGYL